MARLFSRQKPWLPACAGCQQGQPSADLSDMPHYDVTSGNMVAPSCLLAALLHICIARLASTHPLSGRITPQAACVCCWHATPLVTPHSCQHSLLLHTTLPQLPASPDGSFLLGTTPRGPAWWPGGLTAQKALAACPATTRSTARHTAAAARSATSKVWKLTAVSASR